MIKITWGAAAIIIVTVVSIVLWLGAVDSKAADAINRLDRQKDAIKEMRENIVETRDRTIRIETIVEELKRRTDKGF